jgi:hypothetical protein
MTAYSQRNSWYSRIIFGLAIAALLIIQTQAYAELASYTSGAMSGFSGAKNFSAGGNLSVKVEYAVYEPGQFDSAFSGMDPSNGSQYVYAYQLLNLPNSTDSIQKLSVALDSLSSAANISQISDPILPSGIASLPVFAGSPPGSATWSYFSSSVIPPSLKSEILIYTSPFSPQWASSPIRGVSSVGYVPEGGLPSPIPEPFAPLSLALAGSLFLLVRRIRG